MAKKLLGERQIGDAVYTAGQIISDEVFAKSGLKESDVVTVNAASPEAAVAQATPVAPVDKDAAIDAQASTETVEEKKEVEQSSQVGANSTGSEGGASASETASTDLSVEHVLTEQDLIDNPEATKGLKVGDTVRVPAEEKVIDEQMLKDDATLTERGLTVGDKVLVAKA